MSMRTSYIADFKRQVILFAESTNNCATQQKFDVNEKLRGWRKQREKRSAFSVQRRASRGLTTGRHDALKKELRLHVDEKHAKELRGFVTKTKPKLESWPDEMESAGQHLK